METVQKVSGLEQKIQSLEAIVASQAAQIAEMSTLIKFYEEQFKLSQRRQFGSSSEQSPDQLRFDNMFNEAEDQSDLSLPEPTFQEITYKRKKRVGKREADLESLPIERIEYELPESERGCPDCGAVMDDIGVTIRDELKIIPAQVIHVEHAIHAYGCGNCKKDINKNTPVIRAEAPVPLISGSLASPSAVAHIASQKYVNGMPLYRIETGLAYDGVTISRQTMSNWLIYCTQNYLVAIYSLLITYLLAQDIILADETSVQVIKEKGREAKTKSFEWLYRSGSRSDRPVVIYEYQETRNQEHPRKFLGGYRGYLCCDGYQAYHNLPPAIVVAGCWSHVRRYWEKAYEAIPKNQRDGSNAERGLVYCNLLFAFEHEYYTLPPDKRREKRLEYSKPVSDEFFEWVSSLNALPKSLMGEAVGYALSQRKYLENIYLDGRLELSTNLAERSIKPFVTGRKAWLFSFTPNGAKSSSILYSIVETAKANGLNPYRYVKFLLEMLPATTSGNLEELLPWSDTLPDGCRVPVKESTAAPVKPPEYQSKGSLHQALLILREKFMRKYGNLDSSQCGDAQ
jgi:transposase